MTILACPNCGAELVNATCLDDTRWKYFCTGCTAIIDGEPIDTAYAAAARANFKALCEDIRRRDRGE